MMDESYIKLITAYITGTINSEERSELNELIEQGEIDILDIKEMETLYQQMSTLPEAEPSKQMRERFYAALEREKEQLKPSLNQQIGQWFEQARSVFQMRRYALALGVFVGGLIIGNLTTPFQDYRQQLDQLSSEVSQMREVMMLNLLDNESASERLKAVNISTEMQPADNKIAEALLKTLNRDPNVNVRLAAIEALVRHAANPLVREGLINAIADQESPIVQAALADAMLALQEKRAIDAFKKLLDQNGLDRGVRDKLQNTIAALS